MVIVPFKNIDYVLFMTKYSLLSQHTLYILHEQKVVLKVPIDSLTVTGASLLILRRALSGKRE
jgi:hypothetical protein